MTFYPNQLSENHRKMLLHESGLDPGIVAERGYATVRSRAKLLEFKKYQRRAPALRIPIHSPDETTTSAQLRPDNPRKDKKGKALKYETPGDSECILDVHPIMQDEVRRGNGDLYITEGIKKADSLTSRGLPTVGLIGVWNWQRGGEMLPCWDCVRLDGRRVYVVFDSDVMVKEGVQLALERLVAVLEARGAEVLVVYLPGPEKGVDDYLVAGGTVNELKMLARKFEPADFGRIRLSRNEELSVKVGAAWSRWWGEDWSRIVGTGERPHWMRGQSCRDLAKVAIDEVARSGEVVEDGLRFTLPVRRWALSAATSKPTALKGIAHLEAEGWLRRDYGDKAKDAPGSYVLLLGRSSLDHDGSKPGPKGKVTQGLQAYGPGGKGLSAPRLRWSAPTFDRDGDQVVRDYIRRLGKRRGAVIDVLEKEGLMHINEVAEALRVSRVRNLRRNLPMLEEAGIISVSGDTVSLNPDWLEALEIERKLKGEIRNDQGEDGAEERDRTQYRLQGEAFRNRHEVKPANHYANVGADGYVEELQRDEGAATEETQSEPAPISPLASAIRDYLERNPVDACQPPGWIGGTLWAYDLYPDKPTPVQVRAAIDELGGEAYLRSNLDQARRAA